jgi:hypothetical protein
MKMASIGTHSLLHYLAEQLETHQPDSLRVRRDLGTQVQMAARVE